jgi:hypothetical protein
VKNPGYFPLGAERISDFDGLIVLRGENGFANEFFVCLAWEMG